MPTTQSKLSAEEEEEFNKSRKEAMKFMAMMGPCVFMIVTGKFNPKPILKKVSSLTHYLFIRY